MQFRKDVVIDLVCYRRRGHNEAEEPMKTQPIMYEKIRSLPTTRSIYVEKLVSEGVVTSSQADDLVENYRTALESDSHVALSLVQEPDPSLFVDWEPYIGHDWNVPADTTYRQVQKILEDRHKMAAGAMPINWGFAEVMAYATLIDQGLGVRLTGQDVGVGTFSHRHASLYSQKDGKRHIPLNHLSGEVNFDLYDSLLSEEAVLAFEYGYSTTAPTTLVVWEAQFGDFANGAQVVIDQFISSGATKWMRLCGLSLLLPHGYEGAGPEHSSARLERYLQLCAQHNMQVCVPTTPAQVYHMLRRQAIRSARMPLVALTPKSLLRHKLAVSSLEDLSDGTFEPILEEIDELDPAAVERVVLCSGKVYYDLLERRREDDLKTVAIVRMEQIYPFPEQRLEEVIKPYENLKDVVWCQEEPMNQGAWYASQHHMRRVILKHDDSLYLAYAGREPFAAPAGGFAGAHVVRQGRLVEEALYG
jgi:2-oxoglutarate dehydrogenase E1 component